jgi:uncharacterized protein YdeI (YjbR/CyaY-like superfamily)
MIPDETSIRSFESAAALEAWMAKNHDSAKELWLKVHKKGSGLPSVTVAEALDIMLCWGWIDGIRKGFDDRSFLQRYTPRGRRSIWSQVNQGHVARLVAAGRMTEHGQRQIDAAKADGRWAKAYAPMRAASHDSIPEDLRKAIVANEKARKLFESLDRANLFALGFRTNNMKTPEGRAKKISQLVAMLAKGETIIPLREKRRAAGNAPSPPLAKPPTRTRASSRRE